MLHSILNFGNPEVLEYPKFLFCGSFNPLHNGHIAIVDYIYKKHGVPVDFEISLLNVEKNPIRFSDVLARHSQMYGLYKPSFGRLYVTDDARYLEKAQILPEVTFVCGFDTMIALCKGGYYENFDEAINEFNDLGITWLVFPRHKEDGTISTAADFKGMPAKLMDRTTIVDDFEAIDVASRRLRK